MEDNSPNSNHSVDDPGHIEPTATRPIVVKNQKLVNFRHYFLYVLIGGLVISAVISIVAVLTGSFSDFLGRSLLTTFLMVLHALAAIALISATSDSRSQAGEVLVDTTFGLTVLSFITSTLATWKIFTSEITGDLYQIYFFALIASLIVYGLLKAVRSDKMTRLLSNISIAVTAIAFVYNIPSAFDNSYPHSLPDLYYRGLAALAILLGTSTVLTIIFHWMYRNKHPELKNQSEKSQHHMPVALKIVLIILAVVIGLPLFFALLGLLSYLIRY